MNYLHQVPRIRADLEDLVEKDRVFSKLGVNIDSFKWGYIGPGFPGLVRIVLGQQVSTGAADAMWAKMSDYLPCITPNAILVLKDEEMRKLGMAPVKR